MPTTLATAETRSLSRVSSLAKTDLQRKFGWNSNVRMPGSRVSMSVDDSKSCLPKNDSVIRFLTPLQPQRRRDTILTHYTYTNVKVSYWITDRAARDYVMRIFTAFYAIFIVIIGMVMELSNLIAYGTEQIAHLKDLLFAVYMYGASCAVIGYCAANVLREHTKLKQVRRNMAKLSILEAEPEMLTNSSTGSLYLRIGCVVFGLIGCVYYSLLGLVCVFGWDGHTEQECSVTSTAITFLAAFFVFFQMWFVYCNGKVVKAGRGEEMTHKIAINGNAQHIISLGLMHLMATNLWMWMRYILYEEAVTIKEIRLAKFDNSSRDLIHELVQLDFELVSSHMHGTMANETLILDDIHEAAHSHHHLDSHHECRGVQCVFGEFSEFMYTCVVEYSLICAGIAFVFWTNTSKVHDESDEDSHRPMRLRKRNIISIDCSRTAEGLFLGFSFLICSIIAICLFNAYSSEPEMAQLIFLSTNIFFYIVAIFVSCYAFWRMKVLAFNVDHNEEDESAEFLDAILLVVGLIGELVFCLGGILAFLNNRNIQVLSVLLLIANVLRLLQVALQSSLLMIGAKLVLDVENPKALRYKPGKQVITLMLIINLALFFMNIFEAQKAGVTDEIVQMYGSRSWALIVRGCSPLTIFYRFHSSVCFAEIWKKTFKMQRARTRSV